MTKRTNIEKERRRDTRLQRIKDGMCARCGKDKPSEGLLTCDSCRKKEHDLAISDRGKARVKTWREKRIAAGMCTGCNRQPAESLKVMCVVCNDKRMKRSKVRVVGYRDAAFNAYGGYRCSCCGEATPLFLHLDHIDNDGAKHRKETAGSAGTAFYQWLKKHNYPKGLLQVLCANCNTGKHRNGGVCPHESARRKLAEDFESFTFIT